MAVHIHAYTHFSLLLVLFRTANILNNSIGSKTNKGGIATPCHICVVLLVTGKRRGKGDCFWKPATLQRSFQKHHWAATQLQPICNVTDDIFPINKNILLGFLSYGSASPWPLCFFRNAKWTAFTVGLWLSSTCFFPVLSKNNTSMIESSESGRFVPKPQCVCACINHALWNSESLDRCRSGLHTRLGL